MSAQPERLERDEERALVRAWQTGDRRARDGLVRACLPFVVSIAHGYRRWGVAVEDLVQQGCLGVLKAAEKFDCSRDVRFATYAGYWIRAEIRDYVMRSYRVVRIGTTKQERRAIRSYRLAPTDDPQVLAQRSGLSPERTTALMPMLFAREASYEASAGDETFSGAGSSPEEMVSANEVQARAEEAIARAMDRLSSREQMIVRARAFSEDDPISLSLLSVKLGVTKERVRQIEQRAWEKLRGALEPLREDLAAS